MAQDQRRSPGQAAPTAAASGSASDPLVDLARLVGEEYPDAPPSGRRGDEPEFDFGDDFTIYGAAAEDAPYPPEAYAGVPYDGEDGDPDLPRRRRGGMTAALAALAVVVLGVGGVLAYHRLQPGAATGAPPVIRASSEPTKIIPKQASPAKPAGAKLAYDGVTTDTAGSAHVIGGPEEPMERPVTQHAGSDTSAPAPLPNQEIATISKPAAGDGSHQVTTITIHPAEGLKPPTDTLPLATENPTAPGAPPPPVVSITPAEGDHAPPPAKMTAAAKPDAPAPVALPTTPDETGKPVVGTGAAAGMTLMPGNGFGIMQGGGEQTAQTHEAPVAVPQPVPAPARAPEIADAGTPAANAVPLPAARPAGLRLAALAPAEPQHVSEPPTQHADRRPVGAPVRLSPLSLTAAAKASPPAAAHPAAAGGGYMIQLTSRRSQAEAVESFHALQRKYPQLLGSYSAEIQPAKLADRGTFYRVRIGSFPADRASALCKQLKAAGGSCIVQRQ
jgi:hypothetical protein